ncbi:DUF5937 family protein [Dactylosporangium sp. NBC_01737]|uniref:ArsR/SmtB family transcription factor n=1 Tax=Dactylosporangium sp. NBC_01737 TaxID=2975959 RepID=UPI002E114F9F|nr:DUF5937 family protein [Dactylosporangium sp. NBC_01737]
MATIRFALPGNPLERVGFAYGPLPEAVFSLHVLVAPQHHPMHHDWVRRMRALPLPLRRELAGFAFAFGTTAAPAGGIGGALPSPLAGFSPGLLTSFEAGVAFVRSMPEQTVAARFADAVAAGDRLGTPQTRVARDLARTDPSRFADRLCRLLEDYWAAAFAVEYRRVEPQLAQTVADAGRLLVAGGLAAFVATLGPRVRLSISGGSVALDVTCPPHPGAGAGLPDVQVGVTDTFTFTPSAFSWPHVWCGVEAGRPPGMTYPAGFLARQTRPRVPPAQLVRVLRACGDDNRLRVLRWIAERPRSTQELAPLVGLSESTVSKHLRRLADAGVVEPLRDGHYVLYRLRRDCLESLAEALRAFLDPLSRA